MKRSTRRLRRSWGRGGERREPPRRQVRQGSSGRGTTKERRNKVGWVETHQHWRQVSTAFGGSRPTLRTTRRSRRSWGRGGEKDLPRRSRGTRRRRGTKRIAGTLEAMAIEWLEPWWPVDEWSDEQRNCFAKQLHREVGPDHPLYEVPVQIVARHGGSDTTLFELLDDSGRYAVVHLTWRPSQEKMPWPETEIHESLAAFARTAMHNDHQDFVGKEGGSSS
ncbi:hypothetical protein Pla108_38970 [Botrimarina colliarenosi]|uniref:Uncharacterized protein n=1 Tax=Botrimarina colliarenosi TaxID=2528001 RepID=A0A5C6A4T6_9BACT|nr:hypothetical protein Pla108_38970 [Botrimarina colliarenosi]